MSNIEEQAMDYFRANVSRLDDQLLQAHTALRASLDSEDLDVQTFAIERSIRAKADAARVIHSAYRARISLPGVEVLSLYFGYSETLGNRWKIGITGNLANRQKSLRHSMSFLGLKPDFVLNESVTGQAEFVRNMEKLALVDLAEHRHGGEWFHDCLEIQDWFFSAGSKVEEHYRQMIREIDIEAQIFAAKTHEGLSFILFNAEKHPLLYLIALHKEWTKVLSDLITGNDIYGTDGLVGKKTNKSALTISQA